MPEQPLLPQFTTNAWVVVLDGNDTARSIFDRHYSRYHYADGRKPRLFVGPGEKLILVTPCARALFVWRKFISNDGQSGVNCAVFRNEGAGLSSTLIRLATALAWQRWPAERLYTYVNPRAVRPKSQPGKCFIEAGWNRCGKTKKRQFLIFECLAENNLKGDV